MEHKQCLLFMGVPNSGFWLFGRIRIVLWTIRPNKNTNTNSVGSWAFWRCTCCSDIYHLLLLLIIHLLRQLAASQTKKIQYINTMSVANYGRACMLSSHDPLPFIRFPKSGGLSENSWHWLSVVAADVTIAALCMYRLTIRIRSDDTICPNTKTLFGPLFGTEANTNQIFGTSLLLFNCLKIPQHLFNAASPMVWV